MCDGRLPVGVERYQNVSDSTSVAKFLKFLLVGLFYCLFLRICIAAPIALIEVAIMIVLLSLAQYL